MSTIVPSPIEKSNLHAMLGHWSDSTIGGDDRVLAWPVRHLSGGQLFPGDESRACSTRAFNYLRKVPGGPFPCNGKIGFSSLRASVLAGKKDAVGKPVLSCTSCGVFPLVEKDPSGDDRVMVLAEDLLQICKGLHDPARLFTAHWRECFCCIPYVFHLFAYLVQGHVSGVTFE